MDVIIISTSSIQQQNYWQEKLRDVTQARVFVITEDWEGGAGNLLGTLYAFQKSRELLSNEGIDLLDLLDQGKSVAIYHTAGKGKRLYPLVAAEEANKSAVLLPNLMTILEAVIEQTSTYKDALRGRLAVFWGDQIFIPAIPLTPPESHINIFGIFVSAPSKEDWELRHLDQYGILASDNLGNIKLFNKLSYETFTKLEKQENIDPRAKIGISLGSFNLSSSILRALLEEFQVELKNKNGQMDSDPHLLMPTTLSHFTYLQAMKHEITTEAHYQRMQRFKVTFCENLPEQQYFSASDIGEMSYWWDFGNIKSYFANIMKITQNKPEGAALSHFLQLRPTENSCLVNCEINSGHIRNCVLVNVKAEHLDVENCLMINTELNHFTAKECLLYNVSDHTLSALEKTTVRTDFIHPETDLRVPLYSSISRDGKKDWDQLVIKNAYSYQEVEQIIGGKTLKTQGHFLSDQIPSVL